MTPYEVGTLVLSGLLGIVGWLLNAIRGKIDNFQSKFDAIPDVYARRDELTRLESSIVSRLNSIETKLDAFILREHK